MNLGKAPTKSAANPNQSTEESRGRTNDKGHVASSSRDNSSPKAKKEVKIKLESTLGPDPEVKKEPPNPGIHSPIRTVNVRNHPNGTPSSTGKDMTKLSTPHQRRKTTSDSPSRQPTTSADRAASVALSKPSPQIATPLRTKVQTPTDQIPRWRAEVRETPATEDKGAGLLSPPEPLSHLSLTNQKRKRNSGPSLELRKKSRAVHENTSRGSESPSQSRQLSPEPLGSDLHHLASSPPLATPKRLNYAELSTQAIYDQEDDDPSMEFPEIEVPSTPPTLAQPSRMQRNLSTPTKLSAPTPGSAPGFPPSPTKSDPDGIQEMNSFLAYCQKEFNASEQQVIHAIERASGIKQLVELVLQNIVDDKPLPPHILGIWSEEDDRVLMGADSREMKKLQERKGAAHMERRMEFLNLWNMA